MGVLGEFKRGVDVAHGDWFDVREGTHLLGEHPLHPKGHSPKRGVSSLTHHQSASDTSTPLLNSPNTPF
ncbi:hypothetical protein Hanom_Chr09g00828361 [Helianthus anomalus]